MDQKQVAQAISDFALFLSGKRAPALIARSLATIIQLDLTAVCRVIYDWAYQNPSTPLPETVLAARNKVFDIFFYRITRFEKIHSYFPAFEKALLTNCPFDDTREQLAELFRIHRWQDIRPIGQIRDQQQFMMELRKGITVQTEQFNEDIYKNTTFSLLSINKYSFENEQVASRVAGYQAKLKGIFNSFVDLMDDKHLKKEILIANEADRNNVYHTKETFKIETYVLHMTDLGIALFNDDFLYQSLQVFTIINEIQRDHHLNLESFKKFQEKGNLFNYQKLEDYASTRASCHMVRQIIRLFTMFNPSVMLSQLQIEESRRVRRVLLKALECYGREIHSLILSELSGKSHQVPWYYNRNMAYLLGRIVCSVEQYNNHAVELLHNLWQPNTQRQLVLQIISTLGFIGTPSACEKLITRLKLLEPKYDSDSLTADYCQKIVQALINIESDRALDAAIDFCLRQEILGQFKDRFGRIYMSEAFVQSCIGRIRKELQRIKLSFSLLGDKETARDLLRIIAHMRTEPVIQLCRDIVKTISKKNSLAVDAEQILQDTVPFPLYSRDHVLQKLALTKNLPEMICHISESNATGSLIVRTHTAECVVEFERGDAVAANVKNYYVSKEDAFYWCFLLDSNDIQAVYFQTSNPRTKFNIEITKPMEALISEGIVQRNLVYQISSNYLTPDSRFRRRQVNPIYTNFNQTEEPEKYSQVWEALSETVDIDTLHLKTSLSKHDLYRILLYFIKKNMLEIEGQSDKQVITGLEEGLQMLSVNLDRIEKRPVLFNCYKASAEVCADLMRLSSDDVVQFTLGVLRKYYLDSYNARKVFGSAECQLCMHSLALLSGYIRLHTSETRNELLNFLNFSFNVEDESLRPEEVTETVSEVLPTTQLEKLENIDLANDPLDDGAFGEQDFDEMLGALDTVLGSALGKDSAELPKTDEGGQWAGLTESEEIMIRDLFDNIALAYVKPLKDFIRELYRNLEQQRPTSLEWYEMVEPVFTLLSGSSSRMGYQAIADAVNQMEKIVKEQKQLAEEQNRDSFLLEAAYPITEAYQRLCEMQPKTFALLISEEDLSDRKEVLIVKFILKQVTEMNDKLLSKILFAGLNSFDKFMQTNPDEIAALTGTSKKIAEDVMEKFYQYRKIYYKDAPDYWQNYIDLFELNLNLLREMQLDFENLTLREKAGDGDAAKALEKLKADRQRTLWSLFILLCVREEYDLIEMIQQSVFEVRMQLLTDYYTNLVATAVA